MKAKGTYPEHWPEHHIALVLKYDMTSINCTNAIREMVLAGADPCEKPTRKQIRYACYLSDQIPHTLPEGEWDYDYFCNQTRHKLSIDIDTMKDIISDFEDFEDEESVYEYH